MKQYLFKDLSLQAKNRVIGDYIDGWYETHDLGDLDGVDVSEMLDEPDIYYTEDGKLIEGWV